MSTYPTTPTHGGQAVSAAPSKPGTLKAALAVTILAGLSAVAYGAITLAGGVELAREIGAKAVSIVTGDSVDSILAKGGMLLDAATDVAQSTLATRAYLLIVPGALLLLFGLLMGKASTAVRVLATIAAAFTILFGGIIGLDAEAANGLMLATSWGAAIGAIACIVVMWLSPNNRYAKAIKQ